MGRPEFQVVPANEETLVFCTVYVWWQTPKQIVYGVGGDSAVKKNKNGIFGDDEAFKKSYTDALSNAMKQIGVCADVHMGQHDDNKYVAELQREFNGHNKDQANVEDTASAGETAAINAIAACKSREEILALLTRDQNEITALPNGGAQRVKDHAKDRIRKEFPKAKEAA